MGILFSQKLQLGLLRESWYGHKSGPKVPTLKGKKDRTDANRPTPSQYMNANINIEVHMSAFVD